MYEVEPTRKSQSERDTRMHFAHNEPLMHFHLTENWRLHFWQQTLDVDGHTQTISKFEAQKTIYSRDKYAKY